MKPGRELDELIEKNVMGPRPRGCLCTMRESCRACSSYPLPYSTDIAAAWQVVDHIKTRTSCDDFTIMFDLQERKWRAGELWWRQNEGAHWWEPKSAIADTAPHAICLAALKAVGHT